MKSIKLIKKFLIGFLILAFILSPLNFQNLTPRSQAQSIEEITENTIWSKNKTIENSITVDSSVTLTIKKGITITFEDNVILEVKGALIAKGTVENPIKLRGENNDANYSITASDSGEMIMRSVNISGGGIYESWQLIYNSKKFLRKAYAGEYLQGVIVAYNPQKLEMENCKIHDNKAGIVAGGNNVKVNRSKFYDNERFDVMGGGSVDFQYNWWGNADGPNLEEGKIIGSVDYSPWATEENFHDPVIIIPGFAGSWKWTNKSEWKLDPIFKTYDELKETFKLNGYEKDKDLFYFPYNWRGSNVNIAQWLKQRINQVKQETGWPRVDIVAHSMGALATREYIESDYYQYDVDQLVALGTPHSGAPKDYLIWEGGEFGKDIVSNFFEKVFTIEARENGFDSIFDYVRNLPMESVRELLPAYNYLKEADGDDMRQYYDGYPRNEFLENLNEPENISKLDDVELINIFGKTKNSKTISTIRVEETPDNLKPMWQHGYPEGYNSLSGDHGLEYGEGDGTVPLQSAKNILADEGVETNYSHSQLPNKVANLAYKYITGQYPIAEAGEIVMPKNILLIMVLSPIDIQVFYTDQNGIEREIGNKIANQTEDGSAYFKYHLENENGEEIGEEIEFLTIPNPSNGEYKILTQGTGEGEYKIEATKISEDETTGETTESAVSIEGTAVLGEDNELNIEIQNNEVIGKNQDTTPPTITLTSPQNKTYLNNQILNIEFTAEDNQTEPENIETEIYLDGELNTYLNRYLILDLSLQNLGEHKLKVTAQDEAGNQSEEEITFQTNTNPDALIENIQHYHQLKLIKRNKETRILIKSVKNLKKAEKLIQKIQDSKKISEKRKDRIIKFIQKKTNRYIDRIIRYVNHKPDELIKLEVKELLEEGLEWVKY